MALLNTAVISLALASLGVAAPYPTAAKSTETTTVFASEATDRPWYLQKLSADLVQGAIYIRSNGVPESEASAVAHTLVESGLAHPQYTSLAQEIADLLVDDGIYVDATSLYTIATNADSAYQEIRTEPAYTSYIAYATSHASLYDFNQLIPGVPPRLEGAASRHAREQRAAFTSIYASLLADPSGHAALKTLNRVANDYIRDFTKNSTASVNRSVVESLLTYLLD